MLKFYSSVSTYSCAYGASLLVLRVEPFIRSASLLPSSESSQFIWVESFDLQYIILVVWFSDQSLQYTSFLCPQTKRLGASQRPAQHLMCSQGFLRSLTQGQQSTPGHIVDPVPHGVSLASSEMKNFEAWAKWFGKKERKKEKNPWI